MLKAPTIVSSGGGNYRRRFVLVRRFGREREARRFEDLGFLACANSLRRAAAHPGLFAWRPRAMARASAGTFSVMVDPAATYAPRPMRTGATRAVSLPMKTPSPIVVGCFAKPS